MCNMSNISEHVVVGMDVQRTTIGGLFVITMKQVSDERGTVREFYRESAFIEAGLPTLGPWLQVNITESKRGVIRGLHGEDMQKLVAIVQGEAFGAYVDTRPGSETEGKIFTARLTKGTQVLVPRGVCNGFQSTTTGTTQYLYSFDAEWFPGMSGTSLNPFDPALDIAWPIEVISEYSAFVSRKDASAPLIDKPS